MNLAVAVFTALAVLSCAGEQRYDPLEEFEELNITTVIDAPGPEPGRYSAIDRDAIRASGRSDIRSRIPFNPGRKRASRLSISGFIAASSSGRHYIR